MKQLSSSSFPCHPSLTTRNARNGCTLYLKNVSNTEVYWNAFYGICWRMISCCKYFYSDTWGDQRRNWNSLNVLGDGHKEFRNFQMVQFMDNSSHWSLLQLPRCIIWYLRHKLLKSQKESFYFMTKLSKNYWSPKYTSVGHCYETKRKRKT